jgi:hypothetical protein
MQIESFYFYFSNAFYFWCTLLVTKKVTLGQLPDQSFAPFACLQLKQL